MSLQLPIQFKCPDKRISGQEMRSKLLDPESPLYQFLEAFRTRIQTQIDIEPKRMDYHIEILKKEQKNDEQLFLDNITELQNKKIDVHDCENYKFLGRAFVLMTPELKSYGITHITIAYLAPYNSQLKVHQLLKFIPPSI